MSFNFKLLTLQIEWVEIYTYILDKIRIKNSRTRSLGIFYIMLVKKFPIENLIEINRKNNIPFVHV